MNHSGSLLRRVALGAAGGFVGTLAAQALILGSQKWLPAAAPPLRENPGDFMVEQAEKALPPKMRKQIPEVVETAVAQGSAVGYGLTFGALYAMMRPGGGSPLRDGLVLGAICWAAGYLGWLPAAGLMPPLWRQKPTQVAGPFADHLVYGMATVAAYDWLKQRAL